MLIDTTVEPELYSTMVDVFPGVTLGLCSMFRAGTSAEGAVKSGRTATWEGLDIVGWEGRHHLGIDTDPILTERIENPRDLDEGERRLLVRVVVVAEAVRASEDVEVRR